MLCFPGGRDTADTCDTSPIDTPFDRRTVTSVRSVNGSEASEERIGQIAYSVPSVLPGQPDAQ